MNNDHQALEEDICMLKIPKKYYLDIFQYFDVFLKSDFGIHFNLIGFIEILP